MIRIAILCDLLLCTALLAQSSSASAATLSSATGNQAAQAAPKATGIGGPTHYQPERFAGRAGKYYRLIWGVDSLSVKSAEAGEMIRFTFRVVNAGKAKPL